MRCKRTLLAIIASTALVHAASAQQKPDKVVIGYLNLVNAQLVTKALGLHEKEMGVPIEWVKFGSGGDVNRAVAANQLSFGGVGNPPATIGIGRGHCGGQGGCEGEYGRHVGYLGPRGTTGPVVIPGDVGKPRGALDKEIIRRVIRRHLNELRFCYERELAKSPSLAGRVVVTFTLAVPLEYHTEDS